MGVLLARLYDNVLTNLTNPPGLRQTCVNCGQMEVEVEVEDTTDTETSDDNEEDRSDFSDSDLSSTSTDITVRLTRNFSHHNILKKSSGESRTLDYSKSLSSLPPRLETREHTRLTRVRGGTGEIPVRARVQFSLHPHLIYSDQTETIRQPSNHPKLIRQSNVLAGAGLDDQDGESQDTPAPSVTVGDGEEAEFQHYKTMKTGENNYSYAYRDAFSPAALIKLEDCSDVSEALYDSIKAPSEISGVDVMSESLSDKGDLFFSISSKGRRNYLELHRHVGWDMERPKEDEDPAGHSS